MTYKDKETILRQQSKIIAGNEKRAMKKIALLQT
jgi:hypothetical protein